MAATPQKPKQAKEAVTADPGELTKVEREQEQSSDDSDTSTLAPHKPDEEKTAWIEVVLIDEADQPVAGAAVYIKLPDGKLVSGCLNDKGMIRVEGFDPGQCEICFPDLDQDAWEPR